MNDRPEIYVGQIHVRADNLTAEEGHMLGERVRDLVAQYLSDEGAERDVSRISVRIERRLDESMDALAGRIASGIVGHIGQAKIG